MPERDERPRSRRRGKTLARGEYVTDYFLKLAPLPCWKDLTPAEGSRKVRDMIADVEAEAAAKRQAKGKRGKEELGKEKTVIRGPIPVICVPRRGRDPGHGAVCLLARRSRAGVARLNHGPIRLNY